MPPPGRKESGVCIRSRGCAKRDENKGTSTRKDVCKKCGKYAKLKRWLHGVRKAASGWEDGYARRQVEDGVQRGTAAATTFNHPMTHVRVAVHGDDLTFAPVESELRKERSRMCEWYDVKVCGLLGSGRRHVRELEMLGRSLRWTEEGLEYEAE